VTVVDNGSSDATSEVAAIYKQKIRNFRYILDQTPGLHTCRHAGMRASSADILVYADDDIEAFPTWLEGIEESFTDPTIAAAGGKCLPGFEAAPPDWLLTLWDRGQKDNVRILAYLSIIDLGDTSKAINPEYIFGCNMSIRRTVLLEAGGFHPDTMPPHLVRYRGDGETHVMRHITNHGYKAFFNPKASVYHAVPADRMTSEYFRQRAYRQGISDSYTEAREQLLSAHSVAWRVIGNAKKAIARWYRNRDNEVHSSNHINTLTAGGYREGKAYHVAELAKDPALVAWVTRKDYLGGDGNDGTDRG